MSDLAYPVCPRTSTANSCVYYQNINQICDCDKQLAGPAPPTNTPDGGFDAAVAPPDLKCLAIPDTNGVPVGTAAASACGYLVYPDHGVAGPANCLKEEKADWKANNDYIKKMRDIDTQIARIAAQRNNLAMVVALAGTLECDSENARKKEEAKQQQILNEQLTQLKKLNCEREQAWNDVGTALAALTDCGLVHLGVLTHKCGTTSCSIGQQCMPGINAADHSPPHIAWDTTGGVGGSTDGGTGGAADGGAASGADAGAGEGGGAGDGGVHLGAPYFNPGYCLPVTMTPIAKWMSCSHRCRHTVNVASDCELESDCTTAGEGCLLGTDGAYKCGKFPACRIGIGEGGTDQLCNNGATPINGSQANIAITCPVGQICQSTDWAGYGRCATTCGALGGFCNSEVPCCSAEPGVTCQLNVCVAH